MSPPNVATVALARREIPAEWVDVVLAAAAATAADRAALRAVPLALIDALEPAHAVARLAAQKRVDAVGLPDAT